MAALDIDVSSAHTCAALTDGTVWCWGSNEVGQAIPGGATEILTPTRVDGVEGAVRVATSTYHSCALTSDGAILCWGSNQSGAIGDPTASGMHLAPRLIHGSCPDP